MAYQEFSHDLGWASQCSGTKFDHEMSPKHWSNSWPRWEEPRKTEYFLASVDAVLQCELVSPKEGESDCRYFLWQTLKKLRIQDYRSRIAEVHANEINLMGKPWLLHLLIHRKALNFLSWNAASWIRNSVFLSLQVKETFSEEERRNLKFGTLTPMADTPRKILLMQQLDGSLSLFPQYCGVEIDNGEL